MFYLILTCIFLSIISLAKIEPTPDHQRAKTVNGLVVLNYHLLNNYATKFLIYNSKCRIPTLEVWNPDVIPFSTNKTQYTEAYKSCTNKPLLTKIVKKKNRVFLTIDPNSNKHYCLRSVHCCYSNITRNMSAEVPDDNIKISDCSEFEDKVEIFNDVIQVQCACDTLFNTYCYANVHAAIYVTKEFKRRKFKFDDHVPPSVLLIGIDSVSRLNFIRTLPSTLNYVQSKNWIGYQAFNKVGLNTYPNLISLLTGYSLGEIVNVSNPHTDFADNYRMIWNDYRRLGYVTAFAEDMSDINTFNYYKKGFFKQPTDFYFRHYMQSVDSLPIDWRDGVVYCKGSESYNERVLNIAKDFTFTFRAQPSFGLFWMNSFSHDDFNAPMMMDGKIRKFLEDLEGNGIMENTIIFFLSDHGIRVGDVRITWTGWVEERLPFLYLWLPTSFKEAYQTEYVNVQENSLRLTTPFDLYMTLQEILTLSGFNYDVKPSVSCPECKSLFDQIPDVRSCEEAGIQAAWCMCIPYRQFNSESALAIAGANFVINETRKIISESGDDGLKCNRLQLNRVIRSHMSVANDDWYTNKSYMTVLCETSSKMLLEGTIQVNDGNPNFHLTGKISRLDQYRYTSQCVQSELLKTYCHCKSNVNFLWWILSLLQ